MSNTGTCTNIHACTAKPGWTHTPGHCPGEPTDVQCCHKSSSGSSGYYGTCYSGDKEGTCKSSCAGMGKVWVIKGICVDGKDCCINP
jgi:hypothetical protein